MMEKSFCLIGNQFTTVVEKNEILNCVLNPKLAIHLSNDKTYTNDEIFSLFSRIGYYRDGSDVDDPIYEPELINEIYKLYNLSISQSNNIIYFDLPFVSLIKGIKAERIKENLKFYIKLNPNTDLSKNISQMTLTLDFDENISDSKITYFYETCDTDETTNKIVKINDKIFIEQTELENFKLNGY